MIFHSQIMSSHQIKKRGKLSTKAPYFELTKLLIDVIEGLVPELDSRQIILQKCNSRWGDYQCASLISPIKRRGGDPRSVAKAVADRFFEMDESSNCLCEKPEVLGPGFINFRLRVGAIEDWINEINRETEFETFQMSDSR